MTLEVRMHDGMGVAELKRRFSELLSRVELNGEQIAILKRGRPVAALVPIEMATGAVETTAAPRRGLIAATGLWEGFQEVDRFLASVRGDRPAPPSGPEP
jgi:prevent-host-death family protein